MVFRAAFKPTPSIAKSQETVTKDGANIDLVIHGRHDPVVVPRAVVVVESMAAITAMDMLLVSMTSRLDLIQIFFQVENADIVIARTEEPDEIIEETRTNSSGQTENLPLIAPPVELSLSPEETERPYAEYTIRITAPGFEPFVVSGTEVLADVTAIQGIRLRPLSNAPAGEQQLQR